MIRPADQLSPAERVYSAGRPDLIEYHDRIVRSTVSRHGAGIEAALAVAGDKYRAHNAAYVRYLSKGGTPGGQNRSRRWGEADHAYTGALETLAAALGTLYPKPDGSPPITEVAALIAHRVGPLCTGWPEGDTIVHAPTDDCARHPRP
jgi:hypothetical protein